MHNITDASGGKSTLIVQKGDKSITINEFSKEDKNYIIEEFQISDYWTVMAESIYQAFGKTYPTGTDTQNAPLALLGVPNKTNKDSLNDNASDM